MGSRSCDTLRAKRLKASIVVRFSVIKKNAEVGGWLEFYPGTNLFSFNKNGFARRSKKFTIKFKN